jgi:hypothetical protein
MNYPHITPTIADAIQHFRAIHPQNSDQLHGEASRCILG